MTILSASLLFGLLLSFPTMPAFAKDAPECSCNSFITSSVRLNPVPKPERVPGGASKVSGAFTVTNAWSNFATLSHSPR